MIHYRGWSPWNFKQGLLVLISFVMLYSLLSVAHIFWVKHTIGFQRYVETNADFYLNVMIISQSIKAVAIIIVVWFVALKRYKLSWYHLGFRNCSWYWLLIAFFAAILTFILRLYLMKWLAIEIPSWIKFMHHPLSELSLSGVALSAYILLTVFITPIVEEIFYRGFLFQWMSQHRPVWLAALASSLIFGVSHLIPPQAISAALLSLIIISLYVVSGSIWPAIFAHIINNMLSTVGNLIT